MRRYGIVALFIVFLMIGSTVVFAANTPKYEKKTLITDGNGGFQGYVRSGSRGIPGAIVTAHRIYPPPSITVSAATDSGGHYSIEVPFTFMLSIYSLTAKAGGYYSKTKTVLSPPNATVTVNFNLVKSKTNQRDASQSKFMGSITKNSILIKSSSKSYFYLKLTKPIKNPMQMKSLVSHNLPAVFLHPNKTPFVTTTKPKLSSGQKFQR